MKPGTRADREQLVRILVNDLKASVTVLDTHDYRLRYKLSLQCTKNKTVQSTGFNSTTPVASIAILAF